MKKRTMLKIKRMVLKTSVWVAFIVFMISACMLDSESWLPTIVCGVSSAWLLLMGWANGLMGDRK